jgi:transposase
MAPVDRNNPKRAASSESRYSLMEFMREFPDDATCLNFLWRTRYAPDGEHAWCASPSCKTERTFRRYETAQQRQSWTCTTCGHHIHPTAGTIYHKSSTSLHLWFYAIYLMSSTRCGVSAKHLERELGVTYKTAWRMANLIRNQLMTQDDDAPLEGDVEADETYMGGQPREHEKMTRGERFSRKVPVFAAVERGGRVRAEVLPHTGHGAVRPMVTDLVKGSARLYTDESKLYYRMDRQFAEHHTIKHVEKVYVHGNVHTQTIEGFFSTLKNGIRGSYHSVSRKWLQGYLNEYAWRYNHRDDDLGMFRALILRAALPRS